MARGPRAGGTPTRQGPTKRGREKPYKVDGRQTRGFRSCVGLVRRTLERLSHRPVSRRRFQPEGLEAGVLEIVE